MLQQAVFKAAFEAVFDALPQSSNAAADRELNSARSLAAHAAGTLTFCGVAICHLRPDTQALSGLWRN